jgi:hypothetical protein
VLYPNPLNLITSIHRVLNLDADLGAVESMLSDLPSDPVAIEKAVLARIPYHHDWEVYGMPWYCPTVEQVPEKGEGDCKGGALVLASVSEAENITYGLCLSPVHVWVDYEGKNEPSAENSQVEYYQYDPQTGVKRFQIPHISLSEVVDCFWEAFWDPMADGRKALLISGLLGLVGARMVLPKKRTAH